MKNQIEKVEFKTSKGAQVIATAELILSKINYADGWNIEVDCCEMGTVKADIKGFPQQSGFYKFFKPKTVNGVEAISAIGKLAMNRENTIKVENIISKLKQNPAWVAKQEKIRKNQEEIAIMEANRDSSGYCRKCGSYCYGDCEAN
ncbi:MAG: hypothetical protein KJ604_20325 [Gammaproteobacteria bacterium]|nr:hypothetical protein [Gammaproteobacteria bacterium]